MADELELPVHNDGPDEEVEIELSEEELGSDGADAATKTVEPAGDGAEEGAETEGETGAEAEAEAPAPRKKRGENRFAALSQRAQEAERRAQEAELKAQQSEELRRQTDAAMMVHYESALQGRLAEAKRKLRESKELGDFDAETEAQTELLGVHSELQGVQLWKSQRGDQAAPERQPERAAEPQRAPVPKLEPTTAEWIKRNEWFRPNSENFDAEMHEEATSYARRMERRYRAEGRGDEIGSEDYFTEIDRYIRSEFPDAFEGSTPPKKAVPAMKRDNTVAPVSRTGTPGQAGKPSNTVRLSAEQRKFAHQMAASGAYTKAGGTRMNNEEAERHYAAYILKTSRS